MTPLETVLIPTTALIAGWIIRTVYSGRTYVKKDMCQVIHKNLDKTLERIEKKIDKLNGGKI